MHQSVRSSKDLSFRGCYCILLQRKSNGNVYGVLVLTVSGIDFMESELVSLSPNRIGEMLVRFSRANPNTEGCSRFP